MELEQQYVALISLSLWQKLLLLKLEEHQTLFDLRYEGLKPL